MLRTEQFNIYTHFIFSLLEWKLLSVNAPPFFFLAKKGKGIHVVEIFVLPLLIIIVMCLSKFTSMEFVVMLILSLLCEQENPLLILMRRTKKQVNNASLLYFSVLVMFIHCFPICDTTSLETQHLSQLMIWFVVTGA